MKQNQSLFRPFPGEASCIKPHDLLSVGAACKCSRCQLIRDGLTPELHLDMDLLALRGNKAASTGCDLCLFLGHFKANQAHLPRFRFLDTVVLEEGQPAYAIYFQEGRAKIELFSEKGKAGRVTAMKTWLLQRKEQLDLRYQIKKYEREHPSFHFASFQHQSQKRIKQFQNNIKYKVPPILNRLAIVKIRGQREEKLLSKSQFEDLFSLTKQKPCDLGEVQYMQVFPLMHGEEDASYTRTVKYFRSKEANRKAFRLAETYVSTWRTRNDSLEKMEERVWEEITQAEGRQVDETLRLEYITFKILIYFEQLSSMRIEEALVHYVTNDQGRTFYFRNIECLRLEKRIPISDIAVELPNKRETAPQDRINLSQEMRKLFDGFQGQFQRLDRQRIQMEQKVKKDREYSNYVFKTITQRNTDNFHKILNSDNQKYKKEQLGL